MVLKTDYPVEIEFARTLYIFFLFAQFNDRKSFIKSKKFLTFSIKTIKKYYFLIILATSSNKQHVCFGGRGTVPSLQDMRFSINSVTIAHVLKVAEKHMSLGPRNSKREIFPFL